MSGDFHMRMLAERHPELAAMSGRVLGISATAVEEWRRHAARLGRPGGPPRVGSLAALATTMEPKRAAPKPVDAGAALLQAAAAALTVGALKEARREDKIRDAIADAYAALSPYEQARLRAGSINNSAMRRNS